MSPGIRGNFVKEFRSKMDKLVAKMTEIIIGEMSKKKISISVSRDIQAVNESYQELVNQLVMDNA